MVNMGIGIQKTTSTRFSACLVVLFLGDLYFILLLISNNSFIESVRLRSIHKAL